MDAETEAHGEWGLSLPLVDRATGCVLLLPSCLWIPYLMENLNLQQHKVHQVPEERCQDVCSQESRLVAFDFKHRLNQQI
jgi:hypothetical protein